MIVCAPRLVKHITFNFARAITLYPFILLRYPQDKLDPRLINHEKIHFRQQIELLVVPFYILYVMEYSIGRMKGLNHYHAYRNISFEREAFAHEHDPRYLLQRRRFAFWKYRG